MAQELLDARTGIVDRFAVACQDDTRVRAAFVAGSGGAGTADAWADIDLGLVIDDDDYDAFFENRHVFLARLGTPVFHETLNIGFDVLAFIMDTGVDGELLLHRASALDDLHTGPIRPVLDRAGLLENRSFPHAYPTNVDVADELPVVMSWFWRDALHVSRAIARDRPWTAYAFLEKLRGGCQYLIVQARRDASSLPDHFVPFDGYEALDHLPASVEMAMLEDSLCTLEREGMLRAARTLIDIYVRLAPGLAADHGVDYPADAAAVVMRRLDATRPT